MIQLNTQNLHKIPIPHGLIKEFLDKIEEKNQGFYKNIDETEPIQKINDFAAKTEGKYEHIVVLGIGGSALGATCLQKALKPASKKLLVIDNIDPDLLNQTESLIDYSKTLFIVTSKSGDTVETVSQYLYFRKKIEEKNLDPKEHFIFITNPKEGIETFDIPENIVGRFSILTTVALLPAKLIGIDIEKILTGAKTMREKFLSENLEENLPFKFAAIQYSLYKKGKTINVLMPYSQRLEAFTDWYRQLLAESIGKEEKGITPIRALGTTDQHSQLQLYNDGPNDKLIIFIEPEKFESELEIPGKNLTFNHLMKIEKEATEASLTKNNRPNITIKVDSVSEESLGEMLMLMMTSIAFLGEFFQINAFDQPGVEYTKNLIKQSLLK